MNRKKNVDQAIRNGQALLKQTTGNRESDSFGLEEMKIWPAPGQHGGHGNLLILGTVFLGKSMLCRDNVAWGEAVLSQV